MRKWTGTILASVLLLTSCAAQQLPEAIPTPTPTIAATATPAPETTPAPEPTVAPIPTPRPVDGTVEEWIEKELRASFDYFWNESHSVEGAPGYGLTRDNTKDSADYASIASTGFALAGYAIGADRGYITREEAEARALGTLQSFDAFETEDGFYYHFIHANTGKPYDCEVSTIDTALFLCGAIVAGEYFGGAVKEMAQKLYDKIDWTAIVKDNNRFYMAYNKDGNGGFNKVGEWDVAAEQMVMYILSAGSDTHPTSGDLFYGFGRWAATYDGIEYIRSWSNSMFAYQFSHAFVDFRGTVDEKGVDWFANTRNAMLAGRAYAIKNTEGSRTYNQNAWGNSACLGPKGYNGMYGVAPSGMPGGANLDANDGTIATYVALSALPFCPEEAGDAMLYYAGFEKLWGDYGFTDSYNLDVSDEGWFCPYYIGIDKGVTLMMLANAQDGFVWEWFMQNENVQKGMAACGIAAAE